VRNINDGFQNTVYQIGEFSTSPTEICKSSQRKSNRPLGRIGDLDHNTVNVAELRPGTSVGKISHRVDVGRMKEWRTLCKFGLYPCHVQTLQALWQIDHIARVEFCIWLPKNQQLQTKILFTDEVMFHRDSITNTQNSQVWSLANPHASVETDFRNFLLRCYCKPNYRTVCTRRALDIRAIHSFPGRLIANYVRFSSSYQTRAVAAAWRLSSLTLVGTSRSNFQNR
jgi:hypothetical protein